MENGNNANSAPKTDGELPKKFRVLLVDDQPKQVAHVAEYFRIKGHEVTNAVDGKEALRMLFKGGFDCVVVDLLMPAMTGDVLLYYMYNYPELRELSFIVLTTIKDDDLTYRAYRQAAFQIRGGFRQMVKPGNCDTIFKIFDHDTKEAFSRLHRMPGDYKPIPVDY